MKLFHGTTADNLPSILEHGFRTGNGGENWNVSGEAVYFWSPKRLIKAGECDKTDADYYAINNASSSAQFGLGFAKDCRLVIFEVELPEKEVEDDTSCEHMTGAVCTYNDVPPSAIKSIQISNDLSLLKGYFLIYCLNRDMSARTLTPLEEKIAKAMQKAEIYPEDNDLIEFGPYHP